MRSRLKVIDFRCIGAAIAILLSVLLGSSAAQVVTEPRYVINISVDGLGAAYLNALVNTNQTPNFQRFQYEGAWTNNARNDFDNTVTLPNHTTLLTARPVLGAAGHGYTDDGTPPAEMTIHSSKGSYVASIFDVVHDNGCRRRCSPTNPSSFSSSGRTMLPMAHPTQLVPIMAPTRSIRTPISTTPRRWPAAI